MSRRFFIFCQIPDLILITQTITFEILFGPILNLQNTLARHLRTCPCIESVSETNAFLSISISFHFSLLVFVLHIRRHSWPHTSNLPLHIFHVLKPILTLELLHPRCNNLHLLIASDASNNISSILPPFLLQLLLILFKSCSLFNYDNSIFHS